VGYLVWYSSSPVASTKGIICTRRVDGKKAIEWDDITFKEVGKVGVWTKR